ncbi:voltage-gated hydrogen channel 1 [Daphnia magna]|uniref:voltage-gated hydrogen channel 1 n=1 Tax=Daphnia magna TaxID=35525 RepID=UPI0006DF4302|nr:voltage-gated hydrogen channel 1 [Daphnia magna]
MIENSLSATMESTKEMLLPHADIDGIQQSQIEMVTVDKDPGTRLILNGTQLDQHDALLPKDVVLHPCHVYASDPNLTTMPDTSSRGRLRKILNSHRFQVFIVSFVIVDCMVVIAELLMDLRILGMLEETGMKNRSKVPLEAHYIVPDVLHSISIAILAMFLLETVIKIAAFGLSFLRMGWEIFDTVVILVTFVLDVLMQHSHSSTNGLGLFIILRLWRVARILNGMVRSVRSQAVRHVECEKRRREALEEELLKYRELSQRQRKLIIELENLLKTNNIPLPDNVVLPAA